MRDRTITNKMTRGRIVAPFSERYSDDSLADDSPVTEITVAQHWNWSFSRLYFRLRSDNSGLRLFGGRGSQAGSLKRILPRPETAPLSILPKVMNSTPPVEVDGAFEGMPGRN